MAYIKTHQGYEISYDEYDEKFIAENREGEEIASNSSLKLLEATLDRLNKLIFKKIPVWYWNYNEFKKAHITSLNPDERSGWVSIVGDTRRKLDSDYNWRDVYKDNEKNSKIVAQISELDKKIEQLETQKKELKKSMEEISFADLQKNLQSKKEGS